MSNPFGVIITEEDCNICLCMVCARNKNNNVENYAVKKECDRCTCHIGDKMVSCDSDCIGKGFVV